MYSSAEMFPFPFRAAVCDLQQQSERIADRIERKYAGRVRVEMQRREVERETDEEIREAVKEMAR